MHCQICAIAKLDIGGPQFGHRAVSQDATLLLYSLYHSHLHTRNCDDSEKVVAALPQDNIKTYVGETKRTLRVRLGEYKQAVKRATPRMELQYMLTRPSMRLIGIEQK